MNDQTDAQLLRAYVEHRSEAAFAELVRRHVDFVYSAALRMVCDSHLAQDVTQSVFFALAKNAAQLTDRPVLSGWLHRTAQNIAAQTVRTDVRRRAREQEAAAMNQLLSAEPDANWEHIAPHLDAALGELSEPDRDALLLRYFERKSAGEMAEFLGISDEAAQKRVSRAVERLREFLAKLGITVGASGLVVVISANAVQAAPVGLAITISTAAALAGTTLATTTISTMNWINLKAVTAVVAAAVVAGTAMHLLQQREAKRLHTQNQNLISQQERLANERDDATSKLAALQDENERLNRNPTELLRLRAETTRLQGELSVLRAQTASAKPTGESSPSVSAVQPQLAFVTIGGQVSVPGQLVWTQGMKLTDAIRMSEMLTSYADAKAVVTDSSGTRNEYDLRDIIGGRGENPLIKPGDKVHVPRSEGSMNLDPANEIHVTGASVLSSHWPWTNGLRLREAITMAGGLTEFAEGRVQIIYRSKGAGEVYSLRDIQTGRTENPVLEAGDSIHVKPVRPASN